MATIKGADRHARRLKTMRGIALVSEIGKRIFVLADMGRVEAANSITKGSVSGKNHVPSKPGEPPNRDTAQLDSSIVAYKTGPVSAVYSANTPYAAAQEFGHEYSDGRVLAARPYMRPSAEKLKEKAPEIIKQGLNIVIKGS